MNDYLQLRVSIGISRPYRQLRDTPKSYYGTLEALKCRFSIGYDMIVHVDDIGPRRDLGAADYSHLKLLEDQVVHAIKMGDAHRTDALFGEYVAAIRKKEGSFREYPALMIQLISKVYRIVQEQGGSIRNVLGERATIEHFMKLNAFDDIVAWFRHDLFGPVFDYLNDQMESKYVDIANQMVKLIHERYDEDLSLEACAAILNFRPVYLSRVFKKEVGVNFSEHLTEYRMNMAKRRLENTPFKISDIAEKLKYTNTSAFIRTFRRMVGMTPGQYQEQFRKLEIEGNPDA